MRARRVRSAADAATAQATFLPCPAGAGLGGAASALAAQEQRTAALLWSVDHHESHDLFMRGAADQPDASDTDHQSWLFVVVAGQTQVDHVADPPRLAGGPGLALVV